jgi:thiazole synthase/sulfur carrier protein
MGKFGLPSIREWPPGSEATLITIHLNGERKNIPEHMTLVALLEWLQIPTDRVAVERNLEIVPRDRWSDTSGEAGDRLEVVHFVGGGSDTGFPSLYSRSRPRTDLDLSD